MCPANTLEDQIKVIAAYGGIHDWDFPAYIDDDCTGTISEIWDDSGADGTWTYASSKLHAVGGGGSVWQTCISQAVVGEAGTLSFVKEDSRGACFLRATDKDNGYLVYWDADSIGVSHVDAGTHTTLIDMPDVFSGTAEVKVAWREMQYTTQDPHRWLFISIWFDGELGLTIGDNINDRTLGSYIGFAVYDSDTIDFSSIRVPRLASIGDWASLDEGESPGGAIERVIAGRHVEYFLRYDGTMRVLIPSTLSSSQTLTTSLIEGMTRTLDRRPLLSHVKVQGAYVDAEAVDTTIAADVGHRYRRVDCPHLLTESECADEAELLLDKHQEMSDVADFVVPMRVLLEPEDKITLPDGEYRITKIHPTGSMAELKARIQARKYVT
jgi:hypothetical protein